MKHFLYLFSILLFFNTNFLLAQGSEQYGTGLKINVNEDGSKYVRFIIWNQVWARYIQNNPGTAVNGLPQSSTIDLGIRRARMLAYAQISPRFLIVSHFGINNQTFINGGVPGGGITGNGGVGTTGKKPGLFFHDIWNEYTVLAPINAATGEKNPISLSLGAGLHYWHGISRMTSASTLNFLTVDAPIFNWPNIELSDQFARQFGIYAKGKIGKLDYRAHINKPFATATNPNKPAAGAPSVAVDNNAPGKPAYGGYFSYQFLEQEANVLPFTVGSYVGTKRIFNIGAGFYSNPQGTASRRADSTLQRHDIRIFAVDMFADIPFGGNGMAITNYTVYYNYNYGPNYIRNVGIMNVGTNDDAFTGQRAQAGAGNNRPLFGTGSIFYTQAGLLLPKNTLGRLGKLQPFAAYARKQIDALPVNGNYYDLGFNYFIEGHHAKVTLQYSTRPIYIGGEINSNRGEFILQTQIYL